MIGVLTLPFMNLYTKNMTDYTYIDKLLTVLFLTIQLLSIASFASNNLITAPNSFLKILYEILTPFDIPRDV